MKEEVYNFYALTKAWVEVYDVNGRLMHRQAITENVTGIDATNWAEGVYVWKVMADGKLAETGKRIKGLFKEKSI